MHHVILNFLAQYSDPRAIASTPGRSVFVSVVHYILVNVCLFDIFVTSLVLGFSRYPSRGGVDDSQGDCVCSS